MESMIIFVEKRGVSYKRHSIQINLAEHVSEKDRFFDRLQQLIPDVAIYREHPQVVRASGSIWDLVPQDDPREEYGREDEPHVTVLYGLTDAHDMGAIAEHLASIDPFDLRLGEISLFSNKPEYDVAKVDIDCPELHDIHAWIREHCANSLTYPEYKPHMTIAYVRKDAYTPDKNPSFGKSISIRSMEFSHTNGKRYPLSLAI
jgi:2'-5' RNA ligase